MDLSYTKDNQRFNVRVGAIIEKNGQYLVINDHHAIYNYLIGGRIKSFEDSMSAIKRELLEELDEIPSEIRLCFTYESFFRERTLNIEYHEIGYIFHVLLKDDSKFYKEKETNLNGCSFIWSSIDELIEPVFIMEYIKKYGIPNDVVHLISNEIDSNDSR